MESTSSTFSDLSVVPSEDQNNKTDNSIVPAQPVSIETQEEVQIDVKPENTTLANRPQLGKLYPIISAAQFVWNEIGLGILFALIAVGVCRYNNTLGAWLVYNGCYWQLDKFAVDVSEYVQDMALTLQRNLFRIISGMDEKEAEHVTNVINGSLSRRNYRTNILSNARARLKVEASDLDKNKFLFNLANGTLDVISGLLNKHNASDLITKYSPVIYDPTATSPLWDRFVTDITCGRKALARYIQKLFGLCLLGENPLECLWIFYGKTTRNGKTTLLEVIRSVLGGLLGYAISISPATIAAKKLTDGSKATGDIARLEGYRLAIVTEPARRMILDASLIKALTGRDSIVARRLYSSEVEFIADCKILIGTNHLPFIDDISLVDSGRIVVVPFDRHFSPWEIDPQMKEKLQAPEVLSAVLNWMLEGLALAMTEGLEQPDCVQQETAQYYANADWMAQFVSECLTPSDHNSKAKDVYNAYRAWALDNGIKVETKGEFFDTLRDRGMFLDQATVDGLTYKNVVPGYVVVVRDRSYNDID